MHKSNTPSYESNRTSSTYHHNYTTLPNTTHRHHSTIPPYHHHSTAHHSTTHHSTTHHHTTPPHTTPQPTGKLPTTDSEHRELQFHAGRPVSRPCLPACSVVRHLLWGHTLLQPATEVLCAPR